MLLAADRVYLAEDVAIPTGGLLPHPFTLTGDDKGADNKEKERVMLTALLYLLPDPRRSTLCCTCPQITLAIR